MHRFILIFGFVLLPQAVATLKCYECLGDQGSCSNTVKECPASNTQCGVMRVTAYVGSLKSDLILKSCTEPKFCVNGSLSFGVSRTVFTTSCCSSDLCNMQPAPEPAGSNPNGRKRYTCRGQSCDQVVDCVGSEDRCSSASVITEGQKITIKGCVSAPLCTTSPQIPGSFADVTCCQGDYCNSASTSSASLLLLVAPFIPLITFS